MDPLSDVISLLKPHSYTCSGFDVGGDHSVQFPRFEGIKYYALVSGQLWLLVEGSRKRCTSMQETVCCLREDSRVV